MTDTTTEGPDIMKTIRIKTFAAATSVCVLAGLVASLGAPFKW